MAKAAAPKRRSIQSALTSFGIPLPQRQSLRPCSLARYPLTFAHLNLCFPNVYLFNKTTVEAGVAPKLSELEAAKVHDGCKL